MALAPGTRIGPYEISAQIGAGGMGEVYRATDTDLKRQVAIKVLPESVASDAERLARFQREAEVLAALNHPHIAQIYGLARGEGQTGLVMELVEGPTLGDRIAQGPIPVDEALSIAKQIAEALETAHEQGIIHRDLKPQNIKVRPDGTVKVLDFGLAKAMDPVAPSSASNSMSPTITTPAMTQMGMILGTAAYMSPEQAKGRPADRRSDIWAFGAVLYEMLTGQRAFKGEDVSDTMASVLKADTDWSAFPDAVSGTIVAVIKRCLQKDRAQRVRDVGDIALALEGAFEGKGAPSTSLAPVVGRSLWHRALSLSAVLVVVAVIAAGSGWMLKPVEPRPVVRSAHPLPEGRGLRQQTRRALTVSPDGRRFIYNATDGLYVREMDTLADRLIPGTDSRVLTSPVFSPDGQSVAYFQDGQLRRIALSGGASIALARANEVPRGMSWETDGYILYAQSDGIWRVAEGGGEPERLIEEKDGVPGNPQLLPGGWVLFTLASNFQDPEAHIVAASIASGERRMIRPGGSGRYLPSGHLVYTQEGVLYAVPFDAGRLMEAGAAVPVVEGVRLPFGVPNGVVGAQFDVSLTGSLVYLPGPSRVSSAENALALASRTGATERMTTAPGPYVHARASRDGTRLAVDTDDGTEAAVWLYDLSGTSALRRLTFGGNGRFPVWSPDGQRVAFQSDREGSRAIYAQRIDGTGGVERLTMPEKGEEHVPESWSPDGKFLSFSVTTTQTGSPSSLWILSLADGTITRFGSVQSVEPIGSVFSPDGRWIAYHAVPQEGQALTPNSGVFVEPFPATGAVYQAPKVGRDFQPFWSPGGTELFYVGTTASAQLAAVDVETSSGVTFGVPMMLPFALTSGRLSGTTRTFDVLPDGRFVGSVPSSEEDAAAFAATPQIILVQNWLEELERLVPTK